MNRLKLLSASSTADASAKQLLTEHNGAGMRRRLHPVQRNHGEAHPPLVHTSADSEKDVCETPKDLQIVWICLREGPSKRVFQKDLRPHRDYHRTFYLRFVSEAFSEFTEIFFGSAFQAFARFPWWLQIKTLGLNSNLKQL